MSRWVEKSRRGPGRVPGSVTIKLPVCVGSGIFALAWSKRAVELSAPEGRGTLEAVFPFRNTGRQAVTSQISGSIPLTGAHFSASYQWTDRNLSHPPTSTSPSERDLRPD